LCQNRTNFDGVGCPLLRAGVSQFLHSPDRDRLCETGRIEDATAGFDCGRAHKLIVMLIMGEIA
jgi:hypothetical protein